MNTSNNKIFQIPLPRIVNVVDNIIAAVVASLITAALTSTDLNEICNNTRKCNIYCKKGKNKV